MNSNFCSQHHDLYKILIENDTKIDGILTGFHEIRDLISRTVTLEEREVVLANKITELTVVIDKTLNRILDVEKEVFFSKKIFERYMSLVTIVLALGSIVVNLAVKFV